MRTAAERVLVLARLGGDARVIVELLASHGIRAETYDDLRALLAALDADASALLVTAESLSASDVDALLARFADEPAWSELPVILFMPALTDATRAWTHRLIRTRRVTVLARPITALTLWSTVEVAIASRRRQYEIRDLLEREQRAREEAELATRMKDEFLATVSHELRSPLQGISLWAEMLEMSDAGAEVHRAAQAIKAAAEAQRRLVEDLLDLARMLAGKLRLERRVVRLAQHIEASVDVLRPSAVAKGLRIEADLEATAEAFVDPDRLRQVVWNLLTNAIKFTPSGGVIRVRLARAGDTVVVSVTDTGRGIDPAFLPHVFARYLQDDPSAGTRRAGIGVGMSIVRELVERHDGTIEVESAGVGHGTTFTVRLPAVRPRQLAERGLGSAHGPRS